jgi:hypothetical protein
MTIYPEGYVASFLYSETWPDSVQRAYLLVEPDNKGTVQTKTFERQIVEDYHWSRYNNNALVLPDKAPIMGDGLIKHGNLVWARTTNEEV